MRALHREALKARFPGLAGLELEYCWAGVMGMTLNGAQSFGRLEKNVFAWAGCNGVGVAMGTAAGKLLADFVAGEGSPELRDMQALPAPAWIPPEPLLGVGVRSTLARMKAKAGEEAR